MTIFEDAWLTYFNDYLTRAGVISPASADRIASSLDIHGILDYTDNDNTVNMEEA